MIRKTVLLIGAKSDIALAVAHKFAQEGYEIQLAARNTESLIIDKVDMELRYTTSVSLYEFDALNLTSHEDFVGSLSELPSVAVCAVGLMDDQIKYDTDIEMATIAMRSNYEGPASIFAALARHFEKRGSGVLVGISSVAGERGRAVNYIYGSSKAGFTAFLSGLRGRLANRGVHVVTVLPGFVATKMTDGLDLPAMLTAQPSQVADAIYAAVLKKKNVIYVKAIWRFVMFIIRNIPEPIFKKMRI